MDKLMEEFHEFLKENAKRAKGLIGPGKGLPQGVDPVSEAYRNGFRCGHASGRYHAYSEQADRIRVIKWREARLK